VTSSLPPDVRDVFDRFVTTEYTTVDAAGQPITWPVTPYYSQGAATIDVTTGVGYPKKAVDARRNPRVALLFSDPTGCGLENPPAVLVQGTAVVDDADLAENRRRYRREVVEKLPRVKDMLPPKAIEGLLAWYFERIYVKVRPERVFVWEGGDIAREPQLHDARLEEVRSGHTEEPEATAPGSPATEAARPAWDRRMEELGSRYETAVLSWVAPDGFPLAARVPIALDRSARRVSIEAEPVGLPLTPGAACLTAHRHAPEFTWQENFQVRGELDRADGGWTLRPKRLVGGFELPDESRVAGIRRNFRKSIRFHRISREYKKKHRA
jgi:Pyridoxamine 5'-phosphate oxidase